MKIEIFQINLDRDEKGAGFQNIRRLRAQNDGRVRIDSAIYDKVYEFELDGERVDINGLDFELEKIYADFNACPPSDFKGRALSVSDIIRVEGAGSFYCDTVGFCRVRFNPRRAGTLEQSKT